MRAPQSSDLLRPNNCSSQTPACKPSRIRNTICSTVATGPAWSRLGHVSFLAVRQNGYSPAESGAASSRSFAFGFAAINSGPLDFVSWAFCETPTPVADLHYWTRLSSAIYSDGARRVHGAPKTWALGYTWWIRARQS